MKVEETVLTTLLGAGLLVFLMLPMMEGHATGNTCECLVPEHSRPAATPGADISTRCAGKRYGEDSHAGTY